jgi:hypothetical protein
MEKGIYFLYSKLVPPQPGPEAITWLNTPNNRARIITLIVKENKSTDQVAEITKCRPAFVRAVIHRYHYYGIVSPSEKSMGGQDNRLALARCSNTCEHYCPLIAWNEYPSSSNKNLIKAAW